MRVSTPLQYMGYNQAMLKNQTQMSESIEHISSGKRIITAGDDPTSMLTIDNLKQYNLAIEQYKVNITNASYRMGFAETIIGSMDEMVLRARDLMLQGNNGALDEYGRANIAYELEQIHEGLLAFVNIKDESDNYVFSGFATNTKPFDVSNTEKMKYLGDSGEQLVMIDNETSTISNVSGQALIMEAPNPTADLHAIYTKECQGEVFLKHGYRNAELNPELALTLQDQYELTFTQRAGTKVVWASPLQIPAGAIIPAVPTYQLMVHDEAGHALAITLNGQDELDPKKPGGISLQDRLLEAITSPTVSDEVKEKFIIASTIDGDGNSFYLKHRDETKSLSVSVTQLATNTFDDPNLKVTITDENNAVEPMVLEPGKFTRQDQTSLQILDFEPEYPGSNNTIQVDVGLFTTNPLIPTKVVNVVLASDLQTPEALMASFQEQFHNQLQADPAFNQLSVVQEGDEIMIQDPFRILSSMDVAFTPTVGLPATSKFTASFQSKSQALNQTAPVEVNFPPVTLPPTPPTTVNISTAADPLKIKVEPGVEGDPITDVTVTINGGRTLPSYDDPVKLSSVNDLDVAYDIDSNTVRITQDKTDKVIPYSLKPSIRKGMTLDTAGTTNANYTLTLTLVDEKGNDQKPIEIPMIGSSIGSALDLELLLSGYDYSDFENIDGVNSVGYDTTTGELVIDLDEDYTEAYQLRTEFELTTQTTLPLLPTLVLDLDGTLTTPAPGIIVPVPVPLPLVVPQFNSIDVLRFSEREIAQTLSVVRPEQTEDAVYELIMTLDDTTSPLLPLPLQALAIPLNSSSDGITDETLKQAIKAADFTPFTDLDDVQQVVFDEATGTVTIELYMDDAKTYTLNTELALTQVSTIKPDQENLQLSIAGSTTDDLPALIAGGVVTPPLVVPFSLGSGASERTVPPDATLAYEDHFTLTYQGRPDNGNVLGLALEENQYVNIFDTIASAMISLRENANNGVFHEIKNYGRLIDEFDAARNHLTQNRAEFGIRIRQLDLVAFFHEDIKVVNTTILSPLEDLDYSLAVTEMTQREVALNALAAIFNRIVGTVLFDYL